MMTFVIIFAWVFMVYCWYDQRDYVDPFQTDHKTKKEDQK